MVTESLRLENIMRILSLTALVVSSVLFVPTAFADEAGAALYADYCSACHGASGKGDGDMADVISIPSPNLTLLSKNNGGEFPMLRVIHTIDGRTGLRAHGSVMPLFGTSFSKDASDVGYASVLQTRGQILSLAVYLESIQGE
jgi:mono/diheme cytochrome c family protein